MHSAKIVVAAALFALCVAPGISVAQDAGTAEDSTAQAVPDAVAAAEAAVQAARDALDKATADGAGIEEARAALQKALDDLASAREAAGLPPLPPEEMQLPPVPEAPPTPDDSIQPAPDQAAPPAPDEATPPAPDENAQPAPDESVPDEATQPQPPPAAAEPAPEASAPPDAPSTPEPGIEEPAPPPPPAADDQTFDLNKFKERPKFGKMPPPQDLPPSADAVTDGATVAVPGGRTIQKRDGQVVIKHDDANRVRQRGDDVTVVDGPNGTTTETIHRRNGVQIVTVRDRDDNILQRFRKNPDGSIVPLIGPAPKKGTDVAANPPPRPPKNLQLNLGPLKITIPESQYVVDSSKADTKQLESTLVAPPVETVERPYTLDEIRNSDRLRAKVRRVDFDTITFDTNQATVPDNQIGRMESLGRALRAIIQRDPSQVFLIEGHTDAIGSDLYNLALSDRRAETVAQILTYYFGIPAENLVTQGYGERFLKVPTQDANRENRRVAIRNITPLLSSSRSPEGLARAGP